MFDLANWLLDALPRGFVSSFGGSPERAQYSFFVITMLKKRFGVVLSLICDE